MVMSSTQQAGTAYGARDFQARTFLESQRFRDLDRRQSYFDCTQHDYKRFDFEGRVISSAGGMSATQPLLSAEKASFLVPLRSRRPSAPYRLAKVFVKAFTNMVFGEGRFPTFTVQGDTEAEDFVQTLVTSLGLPIKMIRARDLGGAVGSVGLSWAYVAGRPRCRVHNAKNLYVHTWEDREELLPRHVTELYQFPMTEWDSRKRKYVENLYWFRRDWTPNEDIVFVSVLVEPGKDPTWEPDLTRSFQHNDGLIHFVWTQNLPCEDLDGLPDYEGLYENFDTIDVLRSVASKGTALNLDPTLKLKMDADLINRMGIRKGSENALVVGENGDAEYLELDGSGLEAALKLLDSERKTALEVAQCVIPNPDEIAASGTSSVAMKMIYAPMLGQSNILRSQYGNAMIRVLDPMLVVARAGRKNTIIVFDDQGDRQEAVQAVILPPRVETTPVLDDNDVPTGEETMRLVERTPGEGGTLEPVWSDYFQPTPDDQSKVITTLSLAVAAAPILSQETATELAMKAMGRSGQAEFAKIQKASAAQTAQQSQMFADATGDVGGKVTHTAQLPGGATIKRQSGGPTPPSASASESQDSSSSSGSGRESK